MKGQISVGIGFIVVIAVGLIVTGIFLSLPQAPVQPTAELKKFSSLEELTEYIESSSAKAGVGGYFGAFAGRSTGIALPSAAQAEGAVDYSTTNIQVAGVDEADIVKNDGKYLYIVSGSKVVIVDAYPADQAGIVSELEVENPVQEIFINQDKLVVFGSIQEGDYPGGRIAASISYPYPFYSSKMFLQVYDVSDRSNPVLKRNVSMDGGYFDSRMIGDYVYVVVNTPVRRDNIIIPVIEEGGKAQGVPDVYYFDGPIYSHQFTTILAFNTQNDGEEISSKVYLTDSADDLYVSPKNMYISYQKRIDYTPLYERVIDEVIVPALPLSETLEIQQIQSEDIPESEKSQKIFLVYSTYVAGLSPAEQLQVQNDMDVKYQAIFEEISKELEKTTVHRIAIASGVITYQASGEVPGTVLNQFSMDEFKGHFRIATTTGHIARGGGDARNHVYVLNKDLVIVGKLEDLAPGERIYSARFLGEKGYLVTFKKVDPLFVIDLSDPSQPRVLGKLKIPGFSDYLHPYDENHIIGVGKETVEAEQGDFAWFQGIKIALFDVSDVNSPKELSKYVIGHRGTNSEVLQDHKAFLFSRERNLLVLPILLAEIDEEKYPGEIPANVGGDYVYQGAYIFTLDTENGFELKGRVTHVEDDSFDKSGYYFFSPFSVKRSLYIGEVLYTISDQMVKMNDLADLVELNKVTLPSS